MEIEIRDIDGETVKQLFPSCNSCLYWEAPEKFGKDEKGELKVSEDEAIEIKQGWFKRTDSTFGSGGKILYVDGKVVGYVQYAPSHLFEKVAEFSRELFPPSPDGILLSCLHIQAEYREKGLGTRLLQAALEDLRGRGCQALETYSRDDSTRGNSGPTVLYLENSFKLLKTKKWGDATFSLVRFDF
jgi:GNAT superfamily N-acetyltransferase